MTNHTTTEHNMSGHTMTRHTMTRHTMTRHIITRHTITRHTKQEHNDWTLMNRTHNNKKTRPPGLVMNKQEKSSTCIVTFVGLIQ